MSAKAKPACKMRHRALAAAFRKKGSDQGALRSVTPGRSDEQMNQWHESARFDGGDLPMPATLLYQAHTGIANAEPAKRQAT